MYGGDGVSSNASYSSGDEDGDAECRAAINYVSNTVIGYPTSSSTAVESSTNLGQRVERSNEPPKLKHNQIKLQKQLGEILDKTMEIVEVSVNNLDVTTDEGEDAMENGGGIRLFKNAPPGFVFDHIDELQGPAKRPNLIPGQEIDEQSKKFKRKLQSVAVDTGSVIFFIEVGLI